MNGPSRKVKLYVSLGIASVIITISLAIIFYGVYQVFYNPASLFRHDFSQLDNIDQYFGERVVNVALLGLSSGTGEPEELYRVDTLMIASINFDQNSVALVSIPRDSYVNIAGTGERDKIKNAYQYGYSRVGKDPHSRGLSCVVETASSLLEGLIVHYYVAVSMEGLVQLVDSLGGVEFSVDLIVPGDTPEKTLYIGPQLLDGSAYLQYLAYSEPETRDDLQRIERQKNLLRSTFQHFKEMGRFTHILPTYRVYRDHVDTDLHLNQVAALVVFASEMLDLESVSDYSLQGEYMEQEGEHYLILDQQYRDELVMKLFK